jgi:hypothetical protein
MSAVGREVPRVLMVFTIVSAGIVAGCGKGVQVSGQTTTTSTTTGATPDCRGALQGQTYAVCGRLSTAPFPGSSGTTTLLGNVDSGGSGQGSAYAIAGGTFHAGK